MSAITVMPSFIGTFFSNLKRVEFSADTLFVHYKYGMTRSYALTNCTGFAYFEKTKFNGKITFSDNNTIEIGYLDKYQAEILFNTIEKRLTLLLVAKLNQSKELLKSIAFDEFLRDSSIPLLIKTVMPLLEGYRKTPKPWHKHFSVSSLSVLEKLSAFTCIEDLVVGLRSNYEQTILASRQHFYDVIEANPLTTEQRLAVIRDNDKNLVLAAAGTGKTSVMVTKALDLMDRELAKPEQILILAYNKEAALELKSRYSTCCHKSNMKQITPDIMTFHALGRLILSQCNMTTRLSAFVESPIKRQQWLRNWLIEEIKQDSDFLKLFVKLLYQPVNVFDFSNQQAYQSYLTKNRYHSLAGYRVASYQELLIANWLSINGIKHQYQVNYPINESHKKTLKKGEGYRACFYLNEADIYLEHIMIDRQGNTPINLDKSLYLNEVQRIEALHKAHKTNLVNTYHYDWLEGKLEQKLSSIIKRNKVTHNQVSPVIVLNLLDKSGLMSHVTSRYLKYLQVIRTEKMTDEKLNKHFNSHVIIAGDDYKVLLKKIHNAYNRELQKQKAIDFDDMITQSIKALSSGVFIPRWSHILVDEFQDISSSRFEFLQQLISKGHRVRLTAVGDDWQSIYRFSGGNLALTTRFNELVGSHSLSMLQKTFRYNNSIADIAGRFVMQNPEQYTKNVVTHTQVSCAQVVLLDDLVQGQQALGVKVQQVINTIASTDPSASIVVLSRFRAQLNKVQAELTCLTEQEKTNPLQFWTYHGAKGLEADYCILLGFEQGKFGFPCEQQNDLLVESLLPRSDDYPHSEERRLFYVGLTRAKHKAFIIANPKSCSEFVRELIDKDYGIKITSTLFTRDG